MKKAILSVILTVLSMNCMAQGYYTQYYAYKKLKSEALKWYHEGAWRHGFDAAK